MELSQELRDELRRFRLERELTYRQLAPLIGVKLPTLHKAIAQGGPLSEMNHHRIEKFLKGIRSAEVSA